MKSSNTSSVATPSSTASSTAPKTSKQPTIDGPESGIAYSPAAIGHNHHLVEYCRTSMSALAGCTAGIIGLTSLQGFIFYLVMLVIMCGMLLAKGGSNWNRYFTSQWAVFTNGFIGGLTTYVLFWTFLYGMVHVYWSRGPKGFQSIFGFWDISLVGPMGWTRARSHFQFLFFIVSIDQFLDFIV